MTVSSEVACIFDRRRTIQLQGFFGRAATTALHDAAETGFEISGIFQAAEDFANVQLFSAHDYFNHLRLKPLPVTDLSGLTIQPEFAFWTPGRLQYTPTPLTCQGAHHFLLAQAAIQTVGIALRSG